MVKKITEVPLISTVDETVEPALYMEHDGSFYRAKEPEVRKAMNLEYLVTKSNKLCWSVPAAAEAQGEEE